MKMMMTPLWIRLILIGTILCQVSSFSPSTNCQSGSYPRHWVQPRATPETIPSQGKDGTGILINGDSNTNEQDDEVTAGTANRRNHNSWLQKEDNAFATVAARAAICLFESDLKRDAKEQNRDFAVASGATNWIDDASAFALKNTLDKVKLQVR